MQPIKKLELLKRVSEDLSIGKFKNLFKYLEYKKGLELKMAQDFSRNAEYDKASASVLVTSVYDMILSWSDGGGELVSELTDLQIEFDSSNQGTGENA